MSKEPTMRALWSDAFYDMDECGDTRNDFAEKTGKKIRGELDEIKFAIQDLEPKKAIELIKEMQGEY